MVNFRIISKILGSLLFIETFFMGWCLALAFTQHEDDTLAFLLSMLLTFGSGLLFLYSGRHAENILSRRDAYVLVTAAWTVFSVFGMFPYLIHGSITSLTDAFFETMSGFTTTGATIIDDVERLPHGLLFWRSLMQWIGGLGIVFFTIAILPSLVGGSVKVFAAEATGPIKAKMHPRLTTTAKWIWSIYLLLTIGCGLSYWAVGMDWFEALNYSMTTTATGGFSIHNDGTAHFMSPQVDYVSIIFQFLSGINFTLLYVSFIKFRFSSLFKNTEFRLYIAVVVGATLWIGYLLLTRLDYSLEHAFRSSLFHVVSAMTTTGMFAGDDLAQWPHITWIVLGVVMYLGACAGSTSGGFKCIRGVMLLQVVRNNCRAARTHQRPERVAVAPGGTLRLLRAHHPHAALHRHGDARLRRRHHQCPCHCRQLRQQRRSVVDQQHRRSSVVVRAARLHQVAALPPDAHGPSRDHDRPRPLHPHVLEGELTDPTPSYGHPSPTGAGIRARAYQPS